MGKLERKITNEVFIYKIYYKLSSNVSLKKKKKINNIARTLRYRLYLELEIA